METRGETSMYNFLFSKSLQDPPPVHWDDWKQVPGVEYETHCPHLLALWLDAQERSFDLSEASRHVFLESEAVKP
jgi:hypothetical protein